LASKFDYLADVPLRVLGDVGQQADNGCGQALASDFARVGQGRWVDASDYGFRFAEDAIQVGQERVAVCARFVFGCAGSELFRGQLAALQVRHEALDASGDVPQVKADRSQAVRRCPYLLAGQAFGVMRQIFARLLKCIEYGRSERMDAFNGPA